MTVDGLLDRISAAELTEWMGLWTLRNQEQKEAQSAAGPQTKNVRQPMARRR